MSIDHILGYISDWRRAFFSFHDDKKYIQCKRFALPVPINPRKSSRDKGDIVIVKRHKEIE